MNEFVKPYHGVIEAYAGSKGTINYAGAILVIEDAFVLNTFIKSDFYVDRLSIYQLAIQCIADICTKYKAFLRSIEIRECVQIDFTEHSKNENFMRPIFDIFPPQTIVVKFPSDDALNYKNKFKKYILSDAVPFGKMQSQQNPEIYDKYIRQFYIGFNEKYTEQPEFVQIYNLLTPTQQQNVLDYMKGLAINNELAGKSSSKNKSNIA